MTEDFSKKKKNIIFNLPNSIKKMTARKKEDISDDDERVLKEIDIMTGYGIKTKIKKTVAKMPTIEEAMRIILEK
jgi:hypothetical protein